MFKVLTKATFITLLHTFQELKPDALALGLYKKIKRPTFLGTLFILKEVLLRFFYFEQNLSDWSPEFRSDRACS